MISISNQQRSMLLFLLSPFVSLIVSFKDWKSTKFINILWAFIVFYGFTFAIGNESSNSDIIRYKTELERISVKPINTWDAAVDYFNYTGEVDFLRTIIAVVLSNFTSSQSVLTAVYAFIFGFFYTRNVGFILSLLKGKVSLVTATLVLTYCVIIPFWSLGGFRFWTAAHMFLYGVFPFLFHGNKKRLIFCILTLAVHFSFVIPLVILLMFLLSGNFYKFYFILFIASFFITEIDPVVLNSYVEAYLPESILTRTSQYRDAENIQEFRSTTGGGKVWYALWYVKVLNYTVLGLLIYMYSQVIKMSKPDGVLLKSFSFVLLFLAVSNITSTFPSGGRFNYIGNCLAIVFFVYYLGQYASDGKSERNFKWALPFLFFFLFISFRTSLYSLSISTIFGNPLIGLFTINENVSLNDLIK